MAANAVESAPAFVRAAVDALPFGGFRGRTVDAARVTVEVFRRLRMRHVGAMIARTLNDRDTHSPFGA